MEREKWEREQKREEEERWEREKWEREEAKRREQIGRLETEDREREELEWLSDDLLDVNVWDWPLGNTGAPLLTSGHCGSQGQAVEV